MLGFQGTVFIESIKKCTESERIGELMQNASVGTGVKVSSFM